MIDLTDPATLLVALEKPCTNCPTSEQRDANREAWQEWHNREAGAYGAFADRYRQDHPTGNPAIAWEHTEQYHELVAQQPDELPDHGCPECDHTGVAPTPAGRTLLDFIARHGNH